MKKILAILISFSAGLFLVGFTPRSYSDLAEYKRIPMRRRIERFQSAGEDLYLRRKYEDAIVVFENILALDKHDLKSKLWITKAKERLLRERNEQEKKNLYKKYGQLLPKEMTMQNWHWGPSVGHFEVRYSKPKPYVHPVRKVHPKATDAELKEQDKKAKNSGNAEDYFELSMRYWSRKEKDKAIKSFFTAAKLDPEILANDDELLLSEVNAEIQEKLASDNPTANDYITSGRLGMIQGDRKLALKHLINSAVLNPKLKEDVSTIIASFIASPEIDSMSVPADIFSYRQAYVYDKDSDLIYLRLLGLPRNGNQIFPLDVTYDMGSIKKIELISKDVVFVLGFPGIGGAARLWFVLPEKKQYENYEIKVVLHMDRTQAKWVDLSNFSVPLEQPDNWSFIIGSEFNFSADLPKGEYEKNIDGVRVAGYHLSRSDGKGPYLAFDSFKEPMPKKMDIWNLMDAGYQSDL